MTIVAIGSGVASDGPANSVGGRAGSVAWADQVRVFSGEVLTIQVGNSSVSGISISIKANAGGGGEAITARPRTVGLNFIHSENMIFSAPQYTGAYTELINSILPKNLSTYGIGGTSQTRTDGAVILIPNTYPTLDIPDEDYPFQASRPFPNMPPEGETYTESGSMNGFGYRYYRNGYRNAIYHVVTNNFFVPADVTSINVICIGSSNNWDARTHGYTVSEAKYGNLVWAENIPVVPGQFFDLRFNPALNGFDDASPGHQPSSVFKGSNVDILANGPEVFRMNSNRTRQYPPQGSYANVPSGVRYQINERSLPNYGGSSTIVNSALPRGLGGYGQICPANDSEYISKQGLIYVEWALPNFNIPSTVPPVIVTTLAGGNVRGLADGGPIQSYAVDGITRDATNNVIYLADSDYHRIRKMVFNAEVGWQSSTLAGSPARTPGFSDSPRSNARFNLPSDACFSNNMIYVADTGNHAIREVTPSGLVRTLAGNGTAGYKDGHVSTAQFNRPQSVSVDKSGVVYVADTGNGCVRRIAGDTVSTYADGFNAPTKAYIGANERIYVSDSDGVYLLYGYTNSPLSFTYSYQVFTAPGNYTIQVPANCVTVKVVCISAGQSTRDFTIQGTGNGNWRRYTMTMRGNAGTTAWTNSFPFSRRQTFNIVVGNQNNPTSSFGDGDSRLSVNTSVTATVPFQSSAGQSGIAFYSVAISEQEPGPRSYFIFQEGSKQTLSAGVYGGDSTMVRPLIGQAGYVLPPNIQFSELASDNTINNPGLVYVEFTVGVY